MDERTLTGGLAEPVLDAQRVFRTVMDALARPGRIAPLRRAAAPPPPLPPAAGAILLTLCDATTPVFLAAPLGAAAVGGWVAFHAGAPLTEDPAAAAFAVVPGAALDLAAFAPGTPAYPDRSTTVIALVDALDGGPPLVLTGPGIAGTERLAPRGLPTSFAMAWRDNATRYPLGVDLILVADDAIAALPRSTRIGGA